MKNTLLKSFLDDGNMELYETFLENPSKANRDRIEKKFEDFIVKVRLLTYFSQSIYFAAQKYDKKQRRYNLQNQLILDKSFNEEGETLLDSLCDENSEITEEAYLDSELAEYFSNEQLYTAVNALNDRQKDILYLSYIKELKDSEIAKKYGVSQQSINKTKNAILKKLRKALSK